MRASGNHTRHSRGSSRRNAGSIGSVSAEFALAAPLAILIAVGIVDYGMLAARSAALAGATRSGAEYARYHPSDISGIQNTVLQAMSFAAAAPVPTSVARSCECDDRSTISCRESCATNGRPGPNRAFVKVSASQAFSPLVPWPGISASVTAATEFRLQ